MSKTRIAIIGGVAVLVAAMLAITLRDGVSVPDGEDAEELKAEAKSAQPAKKRQARPPAVKSRSAENEGEDEPEAGEQGEEASEPEAMTEEEKREEEEEKRVDEFDATVDKWMEANDERPVTMAEVDSFRDKFRRIPQGRKEECVQRALNLIPDENVMLLAGILFDKTQDKELLDLVYNDILNRDEDVKKPILAEIYKDKEHPNWADTAWILDTTDSLPDGQKQE